ncbi:MAG: RNA methyltransferase [Kiritimatiellae bacterium]|nr:RNA methyltransferase [Kiritimatiellia bacterium]
MQLLENIRIVLCRPIYGGNIGAVCRAMANMGLSDLTLAGAKNINWNDARKMACAAQEILANRRETDALEDAVGDCGLVAGATVRPGLYRQHAITPRECAPQILEAARGGKIALVFGPEDNGLDNIELALCNRLIQIPSAENYRSLNISHAVMVCAYELFIASGIFEPGSEKSPPADTRTKEHMFRMWEKTLLQIGFMEPDKTHHMMLGVRRIFSRGNLSGDDVRILMGIARQTLWCAGQRPAAGEDK